MQAHGEPVLRVKAVLDTGTGRPVVLDGVQHVIHPPRHVAAWDGPPRSSIVLITRDLPPTDVLAALRHFLEDCGAG